MKREATILEMAHEAGFDLAGLAPLAPPPDAERFGAWLEAGHGADMDWLARNRERIEDPRWLAPGGGSLLVVGLAHGRPGFELEGGGKVARYAVGRDYHNRIGKALRKLARRLEREGVLAGGRAGRSMTDAAPLLERSHASAAGIGFASKAANLLHPDHGPWFFLGELVLEPPLEPTPTPPNGSCGTCTACIDACPTDAIRAAGVVDSRRCISYQTIENRGPVPTELRTQLSGWAFGCDICSEVCPWGNKAPDKSADWGTHAGLEGGLLDWLGRDEERFRETWIGSPLKRPRREGLARNAALALADRPSEEAREGLLASLAEDPSPVVREAAAWSLAEAFGEDAGVRAALELAHGREQDPAWLVRLSASVARAGRATSTE